MNQLTKQQIHNLHSKLEEIGEEILSIYNTNFSHELKEDNSPLTKADMLSHDMLIKYLKEEYPKVAIISEEDEATQEIDDKTHIWVIDPLDGTKDFVQKTNEFSIMLALLNTRREPIAGFIYAPALKTLWYAQIDEGAYKIHNSITTQIFTSQIQNVAQAKLVRSRNHFSTKDEEISSKLHITKFIQSGSAGIKFCKIAQGEAEMCYYSTDKMGIWDIAPAHIILEEAGGKIKDMQGNKLKYDLINRKMKYGAIGINNKLDINQIINSIENND